jgi:hypothetical protein
LFFDLNELIKIKQNFYKKNNENSFTKL